MPRAKRFVCQQIQEEHWHERDEGRPRRDEQAEAYGRRRPPRARQQQAEEQQQRPVDLRMPDRMKRTNVRAPGEERACGEEQGGAQGISVGSAPAGGEEAGRRHNQLCGQAQDPRVGVQEMGDHVRHPERRAVRERCIPRDLVDGVGVASARNFVMACSMITSMSPRYESGGALKTAGNSLIATEASSTIPIGSNQDAAPSMPPSRPRSDRAPAMRP